MCRPAWKISHSFPLSVEAVHLLRCVPKQRREKYQQKAKKHSPDHRSDHELERCYTTHVAFFFHVTLISPTHMREGKRKAQQKMDSGLAWFVGSVAFLAALIFWLDLPAFLYTYYRQLMVSKRQGNNGIPSHWFWGNAFYIMNMKPEDRFGHWCRRVQESRTRMTTFWVGPTIMFVLLLHPDPIRKILKEPKDMSVYHMLKPWIGDGLLVSEGKKWFRNRRLLTPAFHYEILKPYVQVSNGCLKVMLEQWERAAEKNEPVKVFD